MKKISVFFLSISVLLVAGCGESAPETTVTLASIEGNTPFVVPVCSKEQCGIVNHKSEVLVPFGRSFVQVHPAPEQQTLFVKRSPQWSVLNPASNQIVTENFANNIRSLTSGLYAAELSDGWAIVDGTGHPINNVRYADIAVAQTDKNPFMVFLTKDQQVGVLDAEGMTVARFSGSRIEFTYIDHLIILKDAQGYQLVDMQTQRSFPVSYNAFYGGANGLYVVSNTQQQWGIINAEGQEVMHMQSKPLAGIPNAGRIAYIDVSPRMHQTAADTQKCGYLDFTGAVAIPAQFDACSPFGEKAAAVRLAGKKTFSIIDTKGKPLNDKEYFGVYWVGAAIPDPIPVVRPDLPSGSTFSADSKAKTTTRHLVPHLVTTIELGAEDKLPYYGLFNLNTGDFFVPPKFARLRVLSPGLIEFVRYDSDEAKALDTKYFVTGLMDFTQKILVEPSTYRYFVLEPGVPYIFAYRKDYTETGFNVLNPQGQVVVADYWARVRYDARFKTFFGYNLIIDAQNLQRSFSLRSAYTEKGQMIFKMIKDGGCPDNNIMYNYANKPLWNTNVACDTAK